MTQSIAIRRYTQRRSGATVVILLAVFAVTMILAGLRARENIAENRAQRLAADRLQARWLAEAGLRRAAAQLLNEADYDGEQWEVSAEELNRAHPASVLIRVEPGSSSGSVKLTARVRYPAEQPRVRITKTASLTLPNEE